MFKKHKIKSDYRASYRVLMKNEVDIHGPPVFAVDLPLV